MNILVATKALPVFDVLQGTEDVECKEALFTGRVYEASSGVRLAVVDFEDLVPHPYTTDMLQGLLAESGIPVVSSEEFLAQPEHWIEEARRGKEEITHRPTKRTIAFVSYSGGTGKTTLALDTARHFAHRTNLPTLLTEFTYGQSALASLVGDPGMPHLFDLATQPDAKAATWHRVTLVPMDYGHCRDLPIALIEKHLKQQIAEHVLTVIDTCWPHALIRTIEDEIDQWLVVATPRADTITNADALRKEKLNHKAAIILNQKRGAGDIVATIGWERALDLPHIQQPDRFEGKLARPILEEVYGPDNWKRYERPKSILERLGIRSRQPEET
jgi:hypothetical protein